ncbi:unnamed protein product [Ambrosiozyma monospora]|uniref:Unnamed protein product n=1 Tax=Ambrosiozyma monospora TaxID=43982 RepID=A0ACB5SVL8_AMBMO|nr:unnamed protein product [Ambrosiozyma monospora]
MVFLQESYMMLVAKIVSPLTNGKLLKTSLTPDVALGTNAKFSWDVFTTLAMSFKLCSTLGGNPKANLSGNVKSSKSNFWYSSKTGLGTAPYEP